MPHFAVQWESKNQPSLPPFLTEVRGKTVRIIHTFSPFVTNVGLPRKTKTSVEKTIKKSNPALASAPNSLYLKKKQNNFAQLQVPITNHHWTLVEISHGTANKSPKQNTTHQDC